MKHVRKTVLLWYSPVEMYELVTGVQDYPSFLPWCDKAEVLVQAPFSPAEGVVTIRRSGIVTVERFSMKGTSHKLSIPIEDGWLPGVQLQVDLVGPAQPVGGGGDCPANTLTPAERVQQNRQEK